MNFLALISSIYFIFTASLFTNAQNANPAFDIFQSEVYPFLQKQCAECHGKNQFDAPQHSPINDPRASYKQILGYVQLSQDWEQSSRLITFGGTRHCKEYLNTDDCGADRAELLSVVRNWINAEISARARVDSSTLTPKKNQASDLLKTSAKRTSSKQKTNPSSYSKSLKIIQISTGVSHTCALFENKKAKCWGNNSSGQLGIGSEIKRFGVTEQEMKSLPYILVNEPILQITAGYNHTCALLENKKAKCWGYNSSGQLGIGSEIERFGVTEQEMRSLPYVLVNEPILQIIASLNHTCALFENKKAKCWGDNSNGQFNINPNQRLAGRTPQEMKSLSYLTEEPILDISVGSFHTCVLTENPSQIVKATCWGSNFDGQLGVGNSNPLLYTNYQEMDHFPRTLIKEPIFQFAAGNTHTCALVEDQFKMKRAKCWGNNSSGQLGIGSNKTSFGTTIEEMQSLPYVLIDEPILQIAAGAEYNCALVQDQFQNKKAKCWGGNERGQLNVGINNRALGQTSEQMQQLPYVMIPDNIIQISAAFFHTCFLLENGKVKCAGLNDDGQLGIGDQIDRGIFDVDDDGELPDALVTAQEEE